MTGILALTHDAYCADLVGDRPALSASIAHLLCTRSPLHAWTAHPKLNPNYQRREEERFDVGVAAHAMLLEGRDAVYVVQAESWRTNEAKEAREEARALGRIPLLAHHKAEVDAMVNAAKEQLAAHHAQPPLFTDGKPEQTLVWEEDGVLCKARVDWLRDDLAALDDLKSTSRSAHYRAYEKNLYQVGGDIQAAMYVRGVETMSGERPSFRWVVVETAAPYALSVIEPGADVLALGDAKVDHALNLWRECLATNDWEAYGNEVHRAELPAWEETRWMEKVAA